MILSLVVLGKAATGNSTSVAPDIIFLNGDIYTESTPARAQAMAVREGRIVAIGSNDDIRKLKREHTQVVDLGGHFVMPGFNDAHLHLAYGGRQALEVNLVGVKSLAEMQQRIAEHAKTTAPQDWIVGGGWDHTLWPGEKLPTRQDIDAVTGDHPAVLSRVDTHIAVANTAALKAAGMLAKIPDPPGGEIDRDASGTATGIVRETARMAMLAKAPRPSLALRRRGIELALADAARWGLTSAQDYSDWEDFLIYQDLEREGKLTLRISEWIAFNQPVDLLAEASRRASGRGSAAAHCDAQGFYGRLAGLAHGGAAGAVFRRSRQLRHPAIRPAHAESHGGGAFGRGISVGISCHRRSRGADGA